MIKTAFDNKEELDKFVKELLDKRLVSVIGFTLSIN